MEATGILPGATCLRSMRRIGSAATAHTLAGMRHYQCQWWRQPGQDRVANHGATTGQVACQRRCEVAEPNSHCRITDSRQPEPPIAAKVGGDCLYLGDGVRPHTSQAVKPSAGAPITDKNKTS